MPEEKPEQDPPIQKVLNPEALGDSSIASLKRLLRLRSEHFDDLNEVGLKLLDRSIFTTYTQCIDAGGKTEAETLINDSLPDFLKKTKTSDK